jgi:uncharacterized protein YkwD
MCATGCTPFATKALTEAPETPRLMTLGAFDGHRLASAILAETNRVRASFGLSPLFPHPVLDAAAAEQSAYMALSTETQHSNPFPGESDVGARVGKLGLTAGHVAENVIMMPALRPEGEEPREYTYTAFAALLVDAWMNSPHHRANILEPGFDYLGCAAQLGRGFAPADQRVYADQVFFLPIRDQRLEVNPSR